MEERDDVDAAADVATRAAEEETLVLELSTAEVRWIASHLGVPELPGVEEEEPDAEPGDPGSLMEHGWVSQQDGGWVLRDDVSSLFAACADPQVVLFTGLVDEGGRTEMTFYVAGEHEVSHSSPLEDVHRFEQLEPQTALRMALAHLALSERPDAPEGEPFDVDEADFYSALERGLSADGEVPSLDVPQLAAAVSRGRFADFTCIYQEADEIVGGSLAWVDGGDDGLWLVEPTGPEFAEEPADEVEADGQPSVRIRPIGDIELGGLVFDLCPDNINPVTLYESGAHLHEAE